MPDDVLALASEIYSPFDRQESRRLRQYVADVEEFVGSRFFDSGEQSVTVSWEQGGPLKSEIVYPGEEAVRAVVGLFRQLYSPGEPTSFISIMKLLSSHVHTRDSVYRDAALSDLKELRKWPQEELRPHVGMTMRTRRADASIEVENYTPTLLIDLFLHGKYLHKGNEKSDRLEAWPLANVAQQVFLTSMWILAKIFYTGANVVREVLAVPDLLDGAARARQP
jgi:hypothetical protein